MNSTALAQTTTARSRRAFFTVGAVGAVGIAGAAMAPRAEAAEAVASVNGQTGAVVLAASDVSAAPLATVDTIAVVATPERFPGIDPTGAADSSPALQAALASVASGGTLIIPPGRYRLNNSLTADRRTVTIQGYGATLIKGANTPPAIKLAGGYSDSLSVSSVTGVTLDGQRGSAIVVSGSVDWVTGDIAKLVADDVIPECRTGNGTSESRVGEYFVVHSVSGNTVNLLGVPRDPFTTNIRLTRVENYQAHLRGLTFETAPEGMPTAWKGSMITLSGFLAPTVHDVTVLSCPGEALVFRGCYGYVAHNVTVRNATNNSATGNFGYAILDNSSAYGNISHLNASRVRHGYTDDTGRVPANSSAIQYGRSYGATISDSVVQGSSVSAFDTHSCSEGITFINCSAYDSKVGFKLRGRKHSIITGGAYGCEYGVQIDTEDNGTDDSWGHRVQGFYGERLPSGVIAVMPHVGQAGRESLRETRPNYISDVVTNDCTPQIIQVVNAVVFLDRLRIRIGASSPNGREVFRFDNSEVRGSDWDVDLTVNTSGTGLGLITPRYTGVLDIANMKARWTGDFKSRISTLINATDDVSVAIANLQITESVNSVSKNLAAGSRVTWVSATQSSATITRKDYQVSDTVTADYIGRSADQLISLICTVTGAGKALPALKPGAFVGQKLDIVNAPESNRTVTLRHGETYNTRLTSGSDVTLPVAGDVSLIWTGAVWKQMYA